MCNFFSCAATKDGRLLFTEQDSHEAIVRRAQLDDDEYGEQRSFVRLEVYRYRHGSEEEHYSVKLDETFCPSWFDEGRNDFETRAIHLRQQVEAAHDDVVSRRSEHETAYEQQYAAYQDRYRAALAPYEENRRTRLNDIADQYRAASEPISNAYDTLSAPLDKRRNEGLKTLAADQEAEWATLDMNDTSARREMRQRHQKAYRALYDDLSSPLQSLDNAYHIIRRGQREQRAVAEEAVWADHKAATEPVRQPFIAEEQALCATNDEASDQITATYRAAIQDLPGYLGPDLEPAQTEEDD